MTSKIKVDSIADQDDNNIINESGDVITVGASGDTVAVAGNIVKSNAYQASDGGNIISQSGTTVTLGASGDTISLASGASQSGFGRTGTVDWQTGSIKTANFTATNGEGYFCNTTSGSFTVTLPSGSAGAIVSVQDYNNTFDSNSLIIDPQSGEKINGGVNGGQIELDTEGEGVTLVYIDSTVGWRSIHQSTFADVGSDAQFVAATGGTIATCGNYKIHTFTSPGTFTVTCAGNACGSNKVDYLVVAGGGAGSHEFSGGGAGGFRESNPAPGSEWSGSPLASPGGALPVTATGYPITVGGGGAGSSNNGNNSVFSTITSAGGGAGTGVGGNPGGSGGGGAAESANDPPTAIPNRQGGSGNTPPVSPPQGQNGGDGANCGSNSSRGGGGGGGAGQVGGTGSPSEAGPGGDGVTSSISGSAVARAGGGAGGEGPPASSKCGGAGGGGSSPAGNGTANTGGGGAGFGRPTGTGGSGGSGIVVIRYKFQ